MKKTQRMNHLKHTLHAVLVLLFVVTLASCGGEDKVGTENMISGPTSKTWVADKELNAAGDKEKLSSAEKDQTMQFYADGRFAMGGGGSLQTGTWTFDQAAKRISLQMEGSDMTESFEVTKLTEDKIHLKAPDGSVMQLETK
ncbi:hypothetical protein MKJ04_19075 [Pontibacter sp. E15-1]|uniref:hypothetical protein n=1 Tax=Pontibacter sp. E15-1 TaxID=2919918 RepID=UPI001F5015A7|nr:hypothetical protein [Pontibacter sp. E15-1]MCJ8166952.1 hypothetical protein [Pontibacter sp. E15-1]